MATAEEIHPTAAEVVQALPKTVPKFPLILQPVHEKSAEQLRTINAAVLPVTYTEAYYRDLVSVSKTNKWSFLAWLNNVLIGNITCRLHDPANNDAALLHRVLEAAVEDDRIGAVALHVQTVNDGAVKFYEAQGLKKHPEVLTEFYPRLKEKGDAFAFSLDLPRAKRVADDGKSKKKK